MAITFNALSYSKQLKSVGVNPLVAEVHAETLANVVHGHSEHLATKADLNALAAATKADLITSLKELEYKLTIKLGSVVTVVVGAIVTIAKFF